MVKQGGIMLVAVFVGVLLALLADDFIRERLEAAAIATEAGTV